jgi:23S rRNA (uracil1939-C5)-methyltransferase
VNSRDERGLRAGSVVEVVVEKGVYRGLGLARHEGQVVFVPRGLPGDRVRARVHSHTSGYVRAEAEELLAPGPGRRASPCPFFPACGGCSYQHLDYHAQLALKEQVLRESLSRAGAAWEGEIPLAGSPERGWRTRASFHLAEGPEGWRLGLYAEGTHRVVDLPYCLQVSEAMNRTQRGLLAALVERPHWVRRVREVDLAESGDGRRLVAALETAMAPAEAVSLASLADAVPWLTGFGVVAGHDRQRRFHLLRGEPYVENEAGGRRLRSHIGSFFQGNRFRLGDLVAAVVDLTPRGGTALDLYAGVGLFALALAEGADSVVGVELNLTAVNDARYNAEVGGLRNVRFHQRDALEGLSSVRVTPGERVILDPPRTGAGADLVRAIASRRPAAIVYVSCDPPTLGRDLKTFAGEGYVPDAVRAFDLFPDTFHLETVARLVPSPPSV